ncbi:MAG: imidazolonepropionase [Candidatus Melainabacteria bacterium RIFCSPLOWO2_12_FULL_35_11]|nr:MAG: imidazolonepropionase [Candidatus Melainabacteria bacterium RIFCSPLOWO2_12_FULL_35_11]
MNADILITNASELLTCKASNFNKPKFGKELSDLGIIKDGAIATKDGKIIFAGKSSEADFNAKNIINAKDRVVMPGFVDCHTHAVFAGSREDEFLKKQQGIAFLDILKQGGGILSTVEKTRCASKEELFQASKKHLKRMIEYGTTTIEIKSGYGLNFEDEKKILEVASNLQEKLPIDIVRTYLGAHTVPKNIKREDYIKEVLSSLERIKPYSEFCDVFCEKGVFSVEETREILIHAKKLGFKLKLHSEQNNLLHSAELAGELNATSADHLEYISPRGIEALVKNGVIGVLLPGVPFYLMEEKYAPARELINKGVAIAIASDFNPGSCPSFNMQLMISLACLKMNLLPGEAINASTINAAFAIDRAHDVGSLETGKKADIIILDIENHNQLPYYFGINLVEKVIKSGKVIFSKEKTHSYKYEP